jgi:hypothetical protein
MIRGFLFVVGSLLLLGACTQRLICPAYQSSFIYDKEAIRQRFSYFKEDSTPKILTASTSKSNRYLVAVPESYRKKFRKMQTVEMKPIYPVLPDSLKEDKGSELLLAEADIPDSTSLKIAVPADSIYAITKTKEKYNLDQDLYMWYFREMLVLPDVRAALENKKDKKAETGAPASNKKSKGGFFRNPFKKKEKSDSTSTTTIPPEKTDVNAPPQKKKGGLFKRNKSDTPEKKKDPAKKKEDGNGF